MKPSHPNQGRTQQEFRSDRPSPWRTQRLASRKGFNVAAFVVLFAACRLTTPVAVAQVGHYDTVFLSADWEVTVFARPQPPSGSITSQELGPAPGLFYQRIEHTLGGNPTPSDVLSVHINRNATHSPKTDCPIAFLNYSEQARTISTEAGTFGGATGPALRQDGNLYVADFTPTRTNPNGALPSAFVPVQSAGLTSNSFRLVVGPGQYDATKHPDFSRTGSPLQFGFARANSHTGSATVTRVTAIDDWSVVISPDDWTVADFGDAPDESLGMETGYYGMVPLPPFGLVFGLVAQSGPAHFPTILTNSGPFAVMNDLFIAPLAGSLESDAIGPTDQDIVFNLDPLADDADNDLADGGGAMVLIFALSSRPPALFFTLAARAPGGPQEGYPRRDRGLLHRVVPDRANDQRSTPGSEVWSRRAGRSLGQHSRARGDLCRSAGRIRDLRTRLGQADRHISPERHDWGARRTGL